jgi:pimeloyl-ACP methyl ester carboxylesterase
VSGVPDSTPIEVASTNGVHVVVHDLGGEGEPLVVAHATGFHGRAYEPLAAGLRDRFHVWAIDFRGHGASTAPADGDFSWLGMRDDLLATADALGWSRLAAFGHSMGGCTVLLAELARPGLVERAYLYEPIIVRAGVEGTVSSPLPAMARRRRARFDSHADALLRFATRPGLSVLRADALAAYVLHGFVPATGGGVELACAPEDEARTFEANAALSTAGLGSIATRVVIARGLADRHDFPAQIAPEVAAGLPRGSLVDYAHLGHFGPLQDPALVAAEIAAALS